MYKYNRVILHGKCVGEAITQLRASADFYYRPVDFAADDDGNDPAAEKESTKSSKICCIKKHKAAFLIATCQLEVVGYNVGEKEMNPESRHIVPPRLKRERRKIIREKLKNRVPVNVLFLMTRISTWSWDGLYRRFSEDERFNPTICVIPWVHDGYDEMCCYMDQAYLALTDKGYHVLRAYDVNVKEYFDLKQLEPDLIFHEIAWYRHVDPDYYIANFDGALNYLIDYGASGAFNPDGHCNLGGHHMADQVFLPSQTELSFYRRFSDTGGKNGVFLGYPKLDALFDPSYQPKTSWREQKTEKKKVIWAPHFLFFADDLYRTSTFVQLYEIMLEIAEKYQDSIQFAFKPHPMLKNALYEQRFGEDEPWGKEKTEEYYSQWSNLPNCQYEDGEFIDLFLTSDAMIFDSISFMSEYACTGKPGLFTIAPTSCLEFDDFGAQAFETLYKCSAVKKEIEDFLENIVLAGKDPMKKERQNFVRKNMQPPGGRLASENIYRYVIEDMTREIPDAGC